MVRLGKISLLIALLSIFPGMISSVGILGALFALTLSGISAISGNLRYVFIVGIITSINLFALSIASTSWMSKQYKIPFCGPSLSGWEEIEDTGDRKNSGLYEFSRIVSIPYGFTLVCTSLGLYIAARKKRRNP